MPANREPIFIAEPVHRVLKLTTEVVATRDPGATTLPELFTAGENGALITSLGAVSLNTGAITNTLRLFLQLPTETQGQFVIETALTNGSAIAYATLPDLDNTRKGLWLPPESKLLAALSTTASPGVLAIVQGGQY